MRNPEETLEEIRDRLDNLPERLAAALSRQAGGARSSAPQGIERPKVPPDLASQRREQLGNLMTGGVQSIGRYLGLTKPESTDAKPALAATKPITMQAKRLQTKLAPANAAKIGSPRPARLTQLSPDTAKRLGVKPDGSLKPPQRGSTAAKAMAAAPQRLSASAASLPGARSNTALAATPASNGVSGDSNKLVEILRELLGIAKTLANRSGQPGRPVPGPRSNMTTRTWEGGPAAARPTASSPSVFVVPKQNVTGGQSASQTQQKAASK